MAMMPLNDELTGAARYFCRQYFGAFALRGFADLEGGRQLYVNWLYYHICHILGEVEAGRITRLIINVQPRSLKSYLTSVALPAWLLGRNPSTRFICVSHSEPLARHFGQQTRALLQAPWYLRTFPGTRLTTTRPRDTDLRTTHHGFRLAVGIGGAITGRGADFIIVDDPIKAQDALSVAARQRVLDFADTALWSRLNDRRRGVIILVMQRFHEDDLAGHLIRRGGWTVVSIPAIAVEDTTHRLSQDPNHIHNRAAGDLLQPEREGLTQIEEQRQALGMYNFAAQYQQDPIPAIGHVVRREWLRYYAREPEQFDGTVISWDTASSTEERSDYTAGTVWGRLNDDFYLLEVIRVRLEVPDLQRLMVEVSRDNPDAAILIEDDGVGRGIAQNLWDRRLTRKPQLIRPTGDKTARFQRHLPLIEEGRLLLPREADWLGDYVAELLAFPVGRHDDQVDSTSQALDRLTRDVVRTRPLVRRDARRRDIVQRSIITP